MCFTMLFSAFQHGNEAIEANGKWSWEMPERMIQCQQTTRGIYIQEFIYSVVVYHHHNWVSERSTDWVRANELRSMCLNAWPKHLISARIHARKRIHMCDMVRILCRCLVCSSSHTVTSCSLRHTHSRFIFAHTHQHLCVYSNAPTLTYGCTLTWRIASQRTHSVIQLKSHAALIVPFFFGVKSK